VPRPGPAEPDGHHGKRRHGHEPFDEECWSEADKAAVATRTATGDATVTTGP